MHELKHLPPKKTRKRMWWFIESVDAGDTEVIIIFSLLSLGDHQHLIVSILRIRSIRSIRSILIFIVVVSVAVIVFAFTVAVLVMKVATVIVVAVVVVVVVFS